MPDALTTISLALLTLLSLVSWGLAMGTLRGAARPSAPALVQKVLAVAIAIGCVALFIYRAAMVHQGWQPLQAHVDGLLLIAPLFVATVIYLESRARVRGLSAFALPVLTLLLGWSVCASYWTFHTFRIDSLWKTVHLAGVYLGTLFFAIAAIAGGMFLYVQNGLRHKSDRVGLGRLASLEAIETLIVRTSALGFGLLTLGLVTGLVIATSWPSNLGPGWWHSQKVLLATAVWLVYGLVMNVRHASVFRGARAAWLSIVGLALLMATFVVVTALPDGGRGQPADRAPPPADVDSAETQPLNLVPGVPGVPGVPEVPGASETAMWVHPAFTLERP